MSKYNPLTLTVKFNTDSVDNLVHRIRNLQTYKLFENDDMLLVDLEEVCDIFMDNLDYEKTNSYENYSKIIYCKDCKFCGWDRQGVTGCFHYKRYQTESANIKPYDFCSYAQPRTGYEEDTRWYEYNRKKIINER